MAGAGDDGVLSGPVKRIGAGLGDPSHDGVRGLVFQLASGDRLGRYLSRNGKELDIKDDDELWHEGAVKWHWLFAGEKVTKLQGYDSTDRKYLAASLVLTTSRGRRITLEGNSFLRGDAFEFNAPKDSEIIGCVWDGGTCKDVRVSKPGESKSTLTARGPTPAPSSLTALEAVIPASPSTPRPASEKDASIIETLGGVTSPSPAPNPASSEFVPPPRKPTRERLAGHQRPACQYGIKCYRKNVKHFEEFAHPGDRNYRFGLVVFSASKDPEFETLKQMFQFFDVDESGYLSKDEFSNCLHTCTTLFASSTTTPEEAWQEITSGECEHVNFNTFAPWAMKAAKSVGLSFSLGVDKQGAKKPCVFRPMAKDARRCDCSDFKPIEGISLCECGHKASMHRSDAADTDAECFLSRAISQRPSWEEGREGLVQIEQQGLLDELQELLRATHKDHDAWTRDRGCTLHGVNGCALSCAVKNRVKVPGGYKLIKAFRNQNADLWKRYSLTKNLVLEDCLQEDSDAAFEIRSVLSQATLDEQLDSKCNEWRLLHGTSWSNCKKICETNFRVDFAGTGATWKAEDSEGKGVPLYGFGIYFAENITKADEYSKTCFDAGSSKGELYTALLCRVIGGKTNFVTTNDIDKSKLWSDVFNGPFHSVFGDRVVELKKPFREFVVYDKDQVFPEFVLMYERS